MRKAAIALISAVVVVLVAAVALLVTSEPAASSPASGGRIASVATRFNASRNGFAFINHPAADPASILGPALAGLCGGMSYASLDYYWAGRPPANSGIDRFLLLRDTESLVVNASSFALWTLAPDTPRPGSSHGVATSTRQAEIPELAAQLRKGPVPLGLVKARDLSHIGQDHQVVAYALERSGSTVRIRIYDPNRPRSDDTFLSVDMAKPTAVAEQCEDDVVDAWRGFFVERYSPVTPPASGK